MSAGLLLPDGSRHKASDALMVSYEDDLADTIKPRAQAAGADVQRLHVLRGRDGELFTLPEHVPALRLHIERTDARLVIVDPLGAAFSQETDSYKDAHVRRALAPLAELAADTGVAVVVVRHLTKSTRERAILSGGGSIGIAGAARFVIAVGPAPDDPSERIMASVKTSVSETPASLRFRLVQHAVSAPDGGDPIETSRVEWLGTSDVTGDELAAARDISAGEDRSALEEARNWLETDLSNGSRLVREVLRDGKAAGFTERTLQRASQQLKVVRHRETPRSPFTWALPSGGGAAFSPAHPVLAKPANIQNRGEDAVFGENARVTPTGDRLQIML